VRTIDGYLNGYSVSSPHIFENYELTIINRKCGILQLAVTKNTSFNVTNNTPIILSVPGGVDGGKSLIINFE